MLVNQKISKSLTTNKEFLRRLFQETTLGPSNWR